MKWNIINVTSVSVPGCVRLGLVGSDWQMLQNSGVAATRADQGKPGLMGGEAAWQLRSLLLHEMAKKDHIHTFQKENMCIYILTIFKWVYIH